MAPRTGCDWDARKENKGLAGCRTGSKLDWGVTGKGGLFAFGGKHGLPDSSVCPGARGLTSLSFCDLICKTEIDNKVSED